MIDIVDNFLEEFKLKSPDNTFLVGFSGGCDSLCLLDMLNTFSKKYGFKLVALHLNHNWRGDESTQDEINCRKFCEQNAIEYISEILIENNQKTEDFARDARYKFFLDYAKKYNNSCIFTAHTRSDNAETVIYRMIKGTGIKGLQGILPKRMLGDYPVYRPLLALSRSDIEGYCISKGLVANTDSSNFDMNYKRNFVRHKIMPVLKGINYSAEKSIVSLANLAISQNKIVDEYLNLIKKDLFFEDKILTEKFRTLSDDVMQKIIHDFCIEKKLDYDYKKITNILEFIKSNFDSKSGSRYSITKDLWLFANAQYIYLITQTKPAKNESEINLTKEGEYDILGTDYIFSLKKYEQIEDLKFPKEDAEFAYVNLDEIGTDLTVRTRRDGDFISPFGMSGSMKIKKYLNSKGISQHEKDGLILLCKGSEVLWVVGVGLSNKLRVVNKPSHVIELRKEYK